MTQSVLEQMGEQIDDAAHKASRAASVVADAFEDGVTKARCVAKQSGRAVTEFYDDTKRRVERNPIEAVVATLAVVLATGAVISWMLRRRNCKD